MVETKRKYDSAEAALEAIDEKVLAHCKRVEDYAALLFNEAVAKELYVSDAKARVRLNEDYLPLLRKAAYYHDIGKAFLPPLYQKARKDFDEAEQAMYHKHVENADKLQALLFSEEDHFNAHERKYVQEGISGHHEHWDGTGFPGGLKGREIPIYARLVALANVFDHLCADTVSEDPFGYAWGKMQELYGTVIDPGLQPLMTSVRNKLLRLYKVHIAETRCVPPGYTFIPRRATRPVCLVYRPIKTRSEDCTVGYQADVRFRNKHELESLSAVDPLLKRGKLYWSLGKYMIYEACDMLDRLDRCNIPAAFIAVELPDAWFNKKGAAKIIADALIDERVDGSRLRYILTTDEVKSKRATFYQNADKMLEVGAKFICKNIYPDLPDVMDLADAHVSAVMIGKNAAEWLKTEEANEYLQQIIDQEIVLIAEDMASEEEERALNFFDVNLAVGNSIGEYAEEETMVNAGLALVNEQDPE